VEHDPIPGAVVIAARQIVKDIDRVLKEAPEMAEGRSCQAAYECGVYIVRLTSIRGWLRSLLEEE